MGPGDESWRRGPQDHQGPRPGLLPEHPQGGSRENARPVRQTRRHLVHGRRREGLELEQPLQVVPCLRARGAPLRPDRLPEKAPARSKAGRREVITLSPSQKIDSICPVLFSSFLRECGQRPDQPADVRRRNSLFVYKDYPAMAASLFRPGLEQRRNRPSIISNQRQTLRRGLSQAGGIILSKKVAAFPLHHRMNGQRLIPAAQANRYLRRNMFVEKQPEHLSVLPLRPLRTLRLRTP